MNNTLAIFLLFFCISSVTFAQEDTKTDKSQFGILMSINRNSLSKTDANWEEIGFTSLENIEAISGIGFAFGMMYGTQLSPLLTVRIQGVMSFTKSGFTYLFSNGTISTSRNWKVVQTEFPFHLLFENTNKKIAPSGLIGARYQVELASKKQTTNPEPQKELHFNDISLDLGAGLAFRFKLFTVKSEIIYSRGIFNQIQSNFLNPFNNAIESAFSNRFSFRILFYG